MRGESSNATRPERRRRHYVDGLLQGRLILLLIGLELALFGISLVVIYGELNAAIDADTFRVHVSDARAAPALVSALLPLAPWVILGNVLVLAAAVAYWRGRVNAVLGPLRDRLTATAGLDLRPPPDRTDTHDVLRAAERWTATERERYRQVCELAASLPSALDPADPRAAAKVRSALQRIQRTLD